jgi:hypothetical protein
MVKINPHSMKNSSMAALSHKLAQVNLPNNFRQPTLSSLEASPFGIVKLQSQGVSLLNVCCHLIDKYAHIPIQSVH